MMTAMMTHKTLRTSAAGHLASGMWRLLTNARTLGRRVATTSLRPYVRSTCSALAMASAGAAALHACPDMVLCDATAPKEPQTVPQNDNIRILCLNGINLDMFGKRDPTIYGTETLADINERMSLLAVEMGVELECFQTNYEGAMVERIHRAYAEGVSAVVINTGAWTHYSYGIRDALAILACPIIEVHMSNIHAREDMSGSQGEQIRCGIASICCMASTFACACSVHRCGPRRKHTHRKNHRKPVRMCVRLGCRHHSVVSPLAKGIVAGFGIDSYMLGLQAAVNTVRGAAKARWYTDGPKKVTNPKKARSPFGA
jgi:3-dehydroquinate dehydratase II